MSLADGVSFLALSPGTGSFVFSQARASFRTPQQALADGAIVDGNTYSYLAQDSLINPTQREWGRALSSGGATSFARTVLGGISHGTDTGTSPVNFTVSPIVSLTILAGDVVALPDIPISGSNPALTDTVVGVTGGSDTRYTVQQLASTVGPSVQSPFYLPNYVTIFPDGVTDNGPNFQHFAIDILPLLTAGTPQTCTISISSPAVVTLTNHGFLQGQPLKFSTTGSLPSGIVAGTPYYVMLANITANTFQISLQNPVAGANNDTWPGGDGAAVNTSGSQSGTQSLSPLGVGWTPVTLPPGNYFSSSDFPIITQSLAKKIVLNAYGVVVSNTAFAESPLELGPNSNTFGTGNVALVNTKQQGAFGGGGGSASDFVKLVNPSDLSKFYAGQWVLLMGLDLQGSGSPPNDHFFEFRQIQNIDVVDAAVQLDNNTMNAYQADWPQYFAGDSTHLPTGGPAMMVGLTSLFDKQIRVNGLTLFDYSFAGGLRYAKFTDCTFGTSGVVGQTFYPTTAKQIIFENCEFQGSIEVDKLIEYLEYKNCRWTTYPQIHLSLFIQSTSVNRLVIDSCELPSTGLNGTPRNVLIKDSYLGSLAIGPIGFGTTNSVTIIDSNINQISSGLGFNFNTVFIQGVPNYSFSNGTLSRPLSDGPIPWAVPGTKCYINDLNGKFPNMGSPFVVTNVRSDGTNTLIDTTLTAAPVGPMTSATVTITAANPAVVNWTTHGLVAGTPVMFTTTGTLPSPINNNTLFYVLAAGLTTNSFEIATSPGGTPINTTGASQSGTHTGWSNPLAYMPHFCSNITVRGSTGCLQAVILSKAPAGLPIYSYDKRVLNINAITTNVAGAFIQPQVWGKLQYMNINVVKPYTGATTPLTLTFSAPGFDDSLAEHDLSQIIDLRTAGLRTITQTTATGSVGGDTIAAYANWIAGLIILTANSNPSGTPASGPYIELEILTDQGYTAYSLLDAVSNDVTVRALMDDNTPSFT